MYTWQIRSQILNLGQNILHIQIKCLILNLTTRKMCQSRVPWVLKDLFYCQILLFFACDLAKSGFVFHFEWKLQTAISL